jgi:LAO/AO transport system kinase
VSGGLSVAQLIAGVEAGDRSVLARAITLVESNRPEHAARAQEVLTALLPRTGSAVRVGVSGPPGVGKSTLLEALGLRLTAAGHKVAVLAIDPSSTVSGGSILGDKTRMEHLSAHASAYVRPSPSGGALGGVHRKTRESLLLCEAAGYDVVLVETVGVGQSEVAVADLVDTFLVLLLPGSGDELQGIKKGILEVADVVAVTKADGEHLTLARQAVQQFSAALRLLRHAPDGWVVPVLPCSAVSGDGVGAVWEAVVAHRAHTLQSGSLASRRAEQRRRWLWAVIDEELGRRFRASPEVAAQVAEVEAAVVAGALPVMAGAARLLG